MDEARRAGGVSAGMTETRTPPTIHGDPPVMVGLAADPLPIIRSEHDRPQFCVQGFERIVGLTLLDLQNLWRRIAHDPRAYLSAAIAHAQRDLEEALADDDADEEDVESAENDLYAFRMFGVLMDHAVENAKRPAPPKPTLAELDAAILALPGVTRVKRHGEGEIVRVLVREDPQLDILDRVDELGAQYRKNEALLDLARAVMVVVRHFENPRCLSVSYEPGDLPENYVLVEDEDNDGESPDPGPFPVHPGSLPTQHWTTYRFRSPDNGIDFAELGSAHKDKARAVDDAWDHFAEVEAGK